MSVVVKLFGAGAGAGAASFNEDDLFTVTVPLAQAVKIAAPPTTPPVEAPVAAPVEAPVDLYETDRAIIDKLAHGEFGRSALLRELGLAQRSGNFKRSIAKLLRTGLIEYTIPDKPNSRLQKYRLTEKGRHAVRDLTRSG